MEANFAMVTAPTPRDGRCPGLQEGTFMLKKLTTIVITGAIEPAITSWEKLGYNVTVRVPDDGPPGFVILHGPAGELMLQSTASLAEDLPPVADRKPSFVLYGEVASLDETRASLPGARVLVERRTTFYGATESWLELDDGTVLGLAQHA